ncbi:dermonecrotic toxin domain-containing protein [Pseudomonas sp. NPDC078416]|uniref:dermonecrotic toxin domain-containing protein n=1 Tax=Pseudomonas sp. NPDC078416 TaxID=3390637 RepID=UPI003CFE4B3A
MTDHIFNNDIHTKPGSLLDHASNEAELSALIVSQLRQVPTVRDAARQMLAEQLRQLRPFPNPDALFIHREDAGGADPAPLCLTDVLLHAFMGDRVYLDDPQAVLSTRKDSSHVAYTLPGFGADAFRTMCEDLIAQLPGYLKFSLNAYWEVDEPTFKSIPGESAVSGTREEIFGTLQSWIYGHAIRLAVGRGELDAQDETRLSRVVGDTEAKGCYGLSLRTSQGTLLPLAGVYAATADDVDAMPLTDDGSHAGVYLFTPAAGVEKFATVSAMSAALMHRLEQDATRYLLAGCLSLEDQTSLDSTPAGALQVEYSLLKEKPASHWMTRLREKQLSDLDHLLAHAPSMEAECDAEARLQMFDDAIRLDDLEEALNVRYLDLLAFIQERRLPDGIRFAAPEDRHRYDTLVAEQTRCEGLMQAQMAGIESPEIFARNEIAAYLMKHLGFTVDPAKVTINLPDEMPFASGPLNAVYTHTLLGFALDGLPELDLQLRPSVEVDAVYSHQRLDFDFISRLLKDLDLKQRFEHELERRYREQTTRDAMAALRASTIALSAWAAKLQGHLSDRGLALIERAQSNLGSTRALSVGGLYLKGGDRRLEDVVVIREGDGDDAFYVLYAPGHPSGRDMFDFDSWRKLSFEIGGWTASARGAQYLLDQTVVNADQHVVPYIESLRLKPSAWNVDSVLFVNVEASSFTEAVSSLSHYKIEQMLTRNRIVSSTRAPYITRQDRMAAVVLGHRISALQKAYDSFGVIPWRAAARQECERLIDKHLKDSGVPGSIDPDTVFFDLDGSSVNGEPDFGRYTTLRCLTDLFMVGYSEEDYAFGPDAAVYSSIGQDVSALSGAFVDEMIRGSDYADEYISELRRHTQGLTNSPPPRLRGLFARKTHYELRRDALTEYIAGRLTPDQYMWIVRMAASLDSSIVGNTAQTPGTLHLLMMEHKTFDGLYVFRPDKDSARLGAWVYTPGAPDGHLFRQEEDVVRSVARPGMSRYYYDRVPYRAQRIIGTLMQKLEMSPVVDGELYAVGYSTPIRSLEGLHGIAVQHLIVDIDAQTESVAERRLLNTYTFIRKYGGYLADLNPMTKLVWTALHASVDLYRGVQAYQDGDRARARGYFAKAAFGAFKAGRQARSIRKAEKLKQLEKAKNSAGSLARS